MDALGKLIIGAVFVIAGVALVILCGGKLGVMG